MLYAERTRNEWYAHGNHRIGKMSAKNYKITITKEPGYWKIHLYTLYTKPVYEPLGKAILRHEEEWHKANISYVDDVALFYWEARFMAWRLKLKLDKGTFGKREETIYERKG